MNEHAQAIQVVLNVPVARTLALRKAPTDGYQSTQRNVDVERDPTDWAKRQREFRYVDLVEIRNMR